MCQSPLDNSHTVLIPAKYNCPSGFTMAYYGYLMSQHYTQARQNFVCVDINPKNMVGGSTTSQDGALLYITEVSCELCVVCVCVC